MCTPKENAVDVDITQLQRAPSGYLMRSQSRRKRKWDERKYVDRISKERALHWLYRRHIVFDLLPEPRRVRHIATNPAERLVALGALDYIGREPDREDVGSLTAFFALLTIVFTVLFDYLPWPNPDIQSVAATLAVVVVAVMMFLLLPLVWKNARVRRLATWANAWSEAIREFRDSPSPVGAETTDEAGFLEATDPAHSREGADPNSSAASPPARVSKPSIFATLNQHLSHLPRISMRKRRRGQTSN